MENGNWRHSFCFIWRKPRGETSCIIHAIHLVTYALISRQKAIKELLTRNAAGFTDSNERFLLETLQIPETWIREAAVSTFDNEHDYHTDFCGQASLARYKGRSFEAYELFFEAEQYQQAHDIAMEDLALDAAITSDHSLLLSLFNKFQPQDIADWSFRGKVCLQMFSSSDTCTDLVGFPQLYLDYATCVMQIPKLTNAMEGAAPDAVDRIQLDKLRRTVPQLIQLLPLLLPDRSNWRQNVCLATMLAALMKLLDPLDTVSTLVLLPHS